MDQVSGSLPAGAGSRLNSVLGVAQSGETAPIGFPNRRSPNDRRQGFLSVTDLITQTSNTTATVFSFLRFDAHIRLPQLQPPDPAKGSQVVYQSVTLVLQKPKTVEFFFLLLSSVMLGPSKLAAR
jgi:hypothetical protein